MISSQALAGSLGRCYPISIVVATDYSIAARAISRRVASRRRTQAKLDLLRAKKPDGVALQARQIALQRHFS
jgi:hypothetical protein